MTRALGALFCRRGPARSPRAPSRAATPPPENDRPDLAGPALTGRPRTTASPALPVPSWSCLPRRTLPPPRAGLTPLPPSRAGEKCCFPALHTLPCRRGVCGIGACFRPIPPRPQSDRPRPAGPALSASANRSRTPASPEFPLPSWSSLARHTLPPPRAGPIPLPPSGIGRKCCCRENPCPRRISSKRAQTGAPTQPGNRCALRPGRRRRTPAEAARGPATGLEP